MPYSEMPYSEMQPSSWFSDESIEMVLGIGSLPTYFGAEELDVT